MKKYREEKFLLSVDTKKVKKNSFYQLEETVKKKKSFHQYEVIVKHQWCVWHKAELLYVPPPPPLGGQEKYKEI